MAFDPDAYLASKADPAAAFDPDTYLATRFGGPAKEEPSGLEALARGAIQGATFGFADEAVGAAESLLGPKTYTEARDESRANFKAAREAHPVLSTVGEVGGGLATSLFPAGAVFKGTGFAVNAARGAAAGIASGFGNSEADNAQDMVRDAAKSGLAGAAFGGAAGALGEKLVRGAPKRVDDRLIQGITGGRATTAGKKIYQDAPNVVAVARKFGLDKVAGDAEALLPQARAALKDVGGKIGAVYEEADRVFLGVPATDVAAALRATAKKYSSPADAPMRRQIDTLVAEVKNSWGKGPRARVPLAKVNELATKLESQGFASADLTPAAGAQLKRDLAKGVNKALDRRMGEIQEFASHVKGTPTAGQSAPLADSMTAADGLKRLLQLNKEYKALKRIEKMGGERAGLPPTSRAAGGLRNAISNGVDTASIAASFATGSPLPYLATKVGIPAAKAVGRSADVALAQLYKAARAGQVTAQMVQRAIEAGVPRGVVERLSSSIAAPADQ